MKEIILVVNALEGGGAEKQASLIKKNLSRNYKIHLLVKNNIVKKIFFQRIIDNLNHLFKLIIMRYRLRNIDYILSILPQSHYFSFLLKIIFKAKLVISFRNDLRFYKDGLEDINSFKFSILNFFADAYVVQSYEFARLLRWKKIKKKVFVVNNIIELPKFEKFSKSNLRRSGIIFVQRLSWQKDPFFMLELIKNIDRRIPISIFGEGNYYEYFINELKLFKNVRVLGKEKNSEIQKYMSNNLIGVLTSFYEGMPNVIAEYIINGCIPVSTKNVYTENLKFFSNDNLVIRGFDPKYDANLINKYYYFLKKNNAVQKKISNLNLNSLRDFHSDFSNYCDWKDIFSSL